MKLPFSFSLKFIFRTLLPGFFLSLGLAPLLEGFTSALGITTSWEQLLLLGTIILGWLLQVSDMHIYMLYEGRRYWPRWLRSRFVGWEVKRLSGLQNRYRQSVEHLRQLNPQESGYASVQNDYIELSHRIRQFPVDENGERTVRFPTALGNLIYTYETYPAQVYGIDAIFYWYWLWAVIDKDLKTQLDDQQGLVDSTVYTAFALNLGGILVLLYSLVAFLHQRGYTSVELVTNNILPLTLSLLSIGLFMTAFLIYRLSLQLHITYGNMFKALFDTHRDKIQVDGVIEEVASLIQDKSLTHMPKLEKYKTVWRYLHNFKVEVNGKKINIRKLDQSP